MIMSVSRFIPLAFLVAVLHGGEAPPAKLIEGLASEEFALRETAQAELQVWAMESPKTSASELLKLSQSTDDPEIRKRAEAVLKVLAEADYLSDGQGYIGILMQEEILEGGAEGEPPMGIRVLDVMPGTPAEKADLRAGDIITALDGKGWKGIGAVTEFGETVAAKKPLVEVKLTIRRGGAEPLDINVKLGKRPIPDLRAAGGDLQKLEERAKERHFKQWLLERRAE